MSTSTDRRSAARERAAERQRQAARRRRQQRAFAVLGVVVLGFGLLVALKLAGVGDKGPSKATSDLDPAVLSQVTNVPTSAFETVGAGLSKNTLVSLPGPALTKDGKPRLVYIGAEYCPFCASQRWAVVVALSRFGTWHGLSETHSASDDVYPNTATFSFHGAHYTSDYLAFEGVETETNQKGVDGRYEKLDSLTDEQLDLLRTFDVPPYVPERAAGAIPFLDLGGRWMVSGSTFMPDVLAERSLKDVAGALDDPGTDVAKGVLGAANLLTAAVCGLTGDQPANVCTTPVVTALKKALPGARQG